MNNTYKISRAIVLYLGLICLTLPCVLFILGWLRPIISIPFALLLVGGVWHCCRNIVSTWHPAYRYCVFSRNDAIKLLLTLLILLFLTDIIGFVGHVQQSADFIVRNAIYSELQQSAWPIYSARGEYFTYYHSFWLPPALLLKMIASNAADLVLFVWVYLTLCVSALALFLKFRGKILLYFVFFLLAGNLIENVKCIPLLIEKYGDSIPCADFLTDCCKTFAVESHYRYLNVWTQYVYTFNHAVPLTLYFSILISGIIPTRYFLFYSSLIFASSPLGAACLFPVLVYKIFRDKCVKETLKRWETWVGSLFVLAIVGYLHGQSGGQAGVVLIWQDYGYWSRVNGAHGAFVDLHVRVLRYLSVLLVMAATVWFITTKPIRKTLFFSSFIYLAIFLPIVWIGRWNNEFLFKGSLVMFMLYAWILVAQWRHSSKCRKIAIVLIVLFSSLHIGGDINRRSLYQYTWNAEKMEANKRLDWGGTLNRPDQYVYNNFWGKNKYPFIYCSSPEEGIIK